MEGFPPWGRGNRGLGRHWHLLTVQCWLVTGIVYVAFLFASGYWRTIVRTDRGIPAEAGDDAGT